MARQRRIGHQLPKAFSVPRPSPYAFLDDKEFAVEGSRRVASKMGIPREDTIKHEKIRLILIDAAHEYGRYLRLFNSRNDKPVFAQLENIQKHLLDLIKSLGFTIATIKGATLKFIDPSDFNLMRKAIWDEILHFNTKAIPLNNAAAVEAFVANIAAGKRERSEAENLLNAIKWLLVKVDDRIKAQKKSKGRMRQPVSVLAEMLAVQANKEFHWKITVSSGASRKGENKLSPMGQFVMNSIDEINKNYVDNWTKDKFPKSIKPMSRDALEKQFQRSRTTKRTKQDRR